MPSYYAIRNNNATHHARIPFQKFKISQLPTTVKHSCKINWKPKISMIEEGLIIDKCRSLTMLDLINATYELGTENAKRKAYCAWKKSKIKCNA